MEQIKVLSMPGCSKCMMLKNLLTSKGVAFEYIEDVDVIVRVGQENNIKGAPIVTVGNDIMTMEKFIDTYKDSLK